MDFGLLLLRLGIGCSMVIFHGYGKMMAGLFEQRPTVFLEFYVELELWKKYVATMPRENEPSP
jgi:hypothetical protein